MTARERKQQVSRFAQLENKKKKNASKQAKNEQNFNSMRVDL